jgi:hypothetical protein
MLSYLYSRLFSHMFRCLCFIPRTFAWHYMGAANMLDTQYFVITIHATYMTDCDTSCLEGASYR